MPRRLLIFAASIVAGYAIPARGESPGTYVADIRAYRLHGGAQGSAGWNGQILQIETTRQHGVFSVKQSGGIQIGDLTIGVRDGEITWNGQPAPPESSTVIANTTIEGRFGEEVVVRTLDTSVPQYFEQVDPNNLGVFRLRTLDDWIGFVATLRVDTPETHPNRRLPAGAYFPALAVRAAIPEGRERIDHVALDIGKPILFVDESESQPSVQPNDWIAFFTVSRDGGSFVTLLRVREAAANTPDVAGTTKGFLFESRVYEINGRLQDDLPRSVLAHSIDGPPVKMLLEPVLHDFPVVNGNGDREQTAADLEAFLSGVPYGGKAELLSAPRLTLRPNPSTRYKVAMVDRGRDPSRPREDVLDSVPSIGDWLAQMGVNDWLAKTDVGVQFGFISDLRNEALSYRTTNSPNKLDSYREYAGILHGAQVQTIQDGALNIQLAFECRRIPKNHRKTFPSLEAAKALASSTAFTSTYQTKSGDVTPFLYSETEERHILILLRVTKLEENT
ncbi:MAG: hypothetical protein AAB353_01235 [Candidatus Hydrogenedentota bacterium]